jgi:hypothetical protein
MPAKPCLKVFWLPGGRDLPNHGAWSDRLQHSGVAEVVGREKTPQLGIGALTANAPAEMASGYIQQNTNKSRSEKMSISNRPLERSIYGSTIFIVPEQSSGSGQWNFDDMQTRRPGIFPAGVRIGLAIASTLLSQTNSRPISPCVKNALR